MGCYPDGTGLPPEKRLQGSGHSTTTRASTQQGQPLFKSISPNRAGCWVSGPAHAQKAGNPTAAVARDDAMLAPRRRVPSTKQHEPLRS